MKSSQLHLAAVTLLYCALACADNSLAMRDVVSEAEVPMISLAASALIINPADPKTKRVFKTPQNDSLMADAVAISMKANGVGRVPAVPNR